MKKFFTVILICLTVFLLYFLGKILPDIYLKLGQEDYESHNYKKAYSDLKIAILLSPKNTDIRRYYTKTLLHFTPTLAIQKEFFKISQSGLNDSSELIADIKIDEWKKRILSNIGENYIDQVPFNGKILRWDIKKFPLMVYIENKSTIAPKYYETEIKRAFFEWQNSSGFINFKFTNNEKEANIKVQINSSTDMKKCEQDDCKYSVAYTTPLISSNLLKRMDIFFYDSNNLNKPFSQIEIYNTAIHEIAHSLGIMGHSYNKSDIMYMETNPNKLKYFDDNIQLISSSDLNTLNLLYKLTPDITNTAKNEFDTSHQFYAPIVMGNDKQINTKKALEAQNYIKMAPDLPNGYIDLAVAFAGEMQYRKAIESLEKALSLSSSDSDKFIIYYNFGVIYMEIKDWDNSLKYAEIAKQINPTAEVYGLTAAIYNKKGNKILAKENYEQAIQKDSENIDYSIDLARIYLKEFNPAQAGKILNKLISANPQSQNDSRVKSLSLITFLFK